METPEMILFEKLKLGQYVNIGKQNGWVVYLSPKCGVVGIEDFIGVITEVPIRLLVQANPQIFGEKLVYEINGRTFSQEWYEHQSKPARFWTEEEDRYVLANVGLKTYREISTHLDRTMKAVRCRWERLKKSGAKVNTPV